MLVAVLITLNYVIYVGNLNSNNIAVEYLMTKNYVTGQENVICKLVENDNLRDEHKNLKKSKDGLRQIMKDMKKIIKKGKKKDFFEENYKSG